MASFTRELECSDKLLQIRQLYIGDVGCVVWDAALVLAKFLENPVYFSKQVAGGGGRGEGVAGNFWDGKKVVDVGAGTGVVGLAAGVLGADVTVTDLPKFVDLMNLNIQLNSAVLRGNVMAKALKWGGGIPREIMEGGKPDFILMSDVVYYEDCLQDLLSTLLHLCDQDTTILMCYEERDTGVKPIIEKKFFEMMNSKFKRKDVPFEDLDNTLRSTDIHVIIFNLL